MFKEASIANSVDQDQTAPIGAVCSGTTLFASILNSSVMLGNYLQQTTSADVFFQMHFSWRFRVNMVCQSTCLFVSSVKNLNSSGKKRVIFFII